MNEPKNLRIGVVIVNYNSGDYLQQCIKSLLKSRAPLDIVVVDNDSLDHSMAGIENLPSGAHRLKIIENDENYGFSKAVNQGAAKLKNTSIMFLNPDCTVFPQTLVKLQQVLASDRHIAIAGALVFNQDGTEQRGCRRNEPTLRRSIVTALGQGKRFEGVDQTFQSLPSKNFEVDAVSGAAMMIRKEYFDQVGGMDEDYFLHCEDLDICRKMRDRDYKVIFCPNASVFHRLGGSSGASSIAIEKYKHQGMLTYNRKHSDGSSPALDRILISLLVYGHFLFVAGICSVKGAFNQFVSRSSLKHKRNNGISTLDLVGNRKPVVVVSGVKSDVGDFLVRHLSGSSFKCIAISRNTSNTKTAGGTEKWLNLDYFIKSPEGEFEIDAWVNLAPIWTTKSLAKAFHKFQPKQIVALSSSSIEGKADSNDEADIEVVEKLEMGEKWLREYATAYGIGAEILRPTMIYGGPRNQNINFIEGLVRYLRIFPIIGDGNAKRQPVHAEDVAVACKLLLEKHQKSVNTYTIGGGEVLSYREMVTRIFRKYGLKERLVTVPPRVVRTAIKIAGRMPRLGFLKPEMANRMGKDLVGSNEKAEKDFGFSPRKFSP